jgi:hypothetical protein
VGGRLDMTRGEKREDKKSRIQVNGTPERVLEQQSTHNQEKQKTKSYPPPSSTVVEVNPGWLESRAGCEKRDRPVIDRRLVAFTRCLREVCYGVGCSWLVTPGLGRAQLLCLGSARRLRWQPQHQAPSIYICGARNSEGL